MDDRYIDNRVSPRLAFRAVAHSFRFHGRSTRSEVVSFWFFGMLANFVVNWLAPTLRETSPLSAIGVLDLLWSTLLFWPFIPLLVRRLHDQGRPWRWALLWGVPIFSSVILLLLPESSDGHGPSISFLSFHRWLAWTPVTTPLLVGSVIAILAIFVLYFLPETPGENRYGPDPRVAPANENRHFGGELASR
ncbi:MAG: DUF805 domain-containing protein [Sphingomonas sp.]|jgi:uncharacterized membrane protein YhaH (DUF805 family)|uniref:DUF805 domain-containing protein n=1 Tax=Sphingomonas sp. TaxID=28214 RepID=UPI0035618DB2